MNIVEEEQLKHAARVDEETDHAGSRIRFQNRFQDENHRI